MARSPAARWCPAAGPGRVMAMPVTADEGRQAQAVTVPPGRPVPPVLWWARGFPGGEDQVREARHWIGDLLPECEPLADIVLLASEACTNAVTHTRSGQPGGRFTVDVEWAPQAARVVIGDQGSPTVPAVTAKTADTAWTDEDGRGLWLVNELADDWGTATRAGNRWVWIDIQWQARGGPLPVAPGGCETAHADITAMREAFPGTTIWWGHQTRTWRAALPGTADTGGECVSAATRSGLCQLLALAYRSSGSPRGHA